MKLINGFDLMEYAKERGYILPAFNTTNMEMTYGIVKGLCSADLPGYVQISSNNLRLSNPFVIADLVRDAVKNIDTPIGLHLDHGKSFEDVKACVDAGFTSIMIDMSHLPFEENMKQSKRAADYCHMYGIPVEVELGALAGKEDDIVNEDNGKTDPRQVPIFVEGTGCDTLAVAIGNVHGLGLTPQIDIPLLEEIRQALPEVKLMVLEPFVLPGDATDSTPEAPQRWETFHREVALRAAAAQRVARKHHACFVPLQARFDAASARGGRGYWLMDGVHPTAMGHELIARAWMEAFRQASNDEWEGKA